MNITEVIRILTDIAHSWGLEKDVLIQLPDNEPPVTFMIDDSYSNTVILFPIPPEEGAVWKHNTNINDWGSPDEPETLPIEYTISLMQNEIDDLKMELKMLRGGL